MKCATSKGILKMILRAVFFILLISLSFPSNSLEIGIGVGKCNIPLDHLPICNHDSFAEAFVRHSIPIVGGLAIEAEGRYRPFQDIGLGKSHVREGIVRLVYRF